MSRRRHSIRNRWDNWGHRVIPTDHFEELLEHEKARNGGELPDALCQADLVHLADESAFKGIEFPGRREIARRWGRSEWAVREHLRSAGWQKKCRDLRIPLPRLDKIGKPSHLPPTNHPTHRPPTIPPQQGRTPRIEPEPPTNHPSNRPETIPLTSTRAEIEPRAPSPEPQRTDLDRHLDPVADEHERTDTAGNPILDLPAALEEIDAATYGTDETVIDGAPPAPERPPDPPKAKPKPDAARSEAFRSAAAYWGDTVNRCMGKRPSAGPSKSSKAGQRLWREIGKTHEVDGRKVAGIDMVMAAFRFVAESPHKRAVFVRSEKYTMMTALRHLEDYAELWWADHPPDDETPPDGSPSDRDQRLAADGVPASIRHLPDHQIQRIMEQRRQLEAEKKIRRGRRKPAADPRGDG